MLEVCRAVKNFVAPSNHSQRRPANICLDPLATSKYQILVQVAGPVRAFVAGLCATRLHNLTPTRPSSAQALPAPLPSSSPPALVRVSSAPAYARESFLTGLREESRRLARLK